jgi:hypothetical protein
VSSWLFANQLAVARRNLARLLSTMALAAPPLIMLDLLVLEINALISRICKQTPRFGGIRLARTWFLRSVM